MNRIGESAGRSLLDGFEAQTQALPTIADRAMTDTEKLLNRSLETSATSLLDQFNSKFDERLGKIESDFESNPIVGKIDLEVDKDALNRQIKTDKVKRDDAILQVSESRLLTRGTGDDPAKQTQQNTANAVKELQELRKQIANQNKSNTTIKVLTA
jgi:phage shock protein A